MKTFSNNLLLELETKLNNIQSLYNNPIEYAEHGIKAAIKAIQKLKTFFNSYNFENTAAEIEFFKGIKPEFASRLIYYNEIYNIEIAKPACSEKALKKYYKSHQIKLEEFYLENADFYKYYRSKNTALDKKYFLRRKHDIKFTLDSSYFQSDQTFTTSHDYKLSKIKALDKIQLFLERRIKNEAPLVNNTTDPKLKWTASKVALVELVYALHAEKVFNGGTKSLKDTVTVFESAFQIELGQFNRSYLEIRNRKSMEKTHFLNTLKQNLETRMKIGDEK